MTIGSDVFCVRNKQRSRKYRKVNLGLVLITVLVSSKFNICIEKKLMR